MTYTKWLRGAIICGIFATLLIPFIIASANLSNPANWLFPVNAFFPFITGKNFVFRILTELMFGLYVLLALRNPQYRPRSSMVLWSVSLFVVWAGIATIFSVDPLKSFWSNFERMEGFISVLHLFLYFLVVSAVMNTERLQTWFLRTSVWASLAMSFYGVLQLTHVIAIDQGSIRVDGTLGNAIYFAVYMLFNIFFALWLIYRDRTIGPWRWAYAGIAVIDVFMLLFSETRGTMLGLFGGIIVGVAYFWWIAGEEVGLRRMRRIALWSLAGMVFLGALFIALRNQPFIQHIPGFDRLASISLTGGESKTRLVIWGMAWKGFEERPITGWGQENFNFVFNKYYEPELWGQEAWFDRAHNSYIDWAINAGAPGFILFVGVMLVALWSVVRARDLAVIERTILVGLIVGFAIHEFFVFDNVVSSIQFFTLLAFIHLLVRREVPRMLWMSRPVGDQGLAVVAPIALIVTLGSVWFLNAPGIASATTLLTALQPVNSSSGTPDLARNLQYFEDALADGPLGRQEVVEQMVTAAISVSTAQGVSPDIKQKYYDASLAAMDALTKQRPHDARLELFYGNFLSQFGNAPEAQKEFQLAQADSPKKQQILFELGVTSYLRSGDVQSAVATLKQAFELDPTYDDARTYYAAALYYSGATAQADKLLTDRYGTVEVDNNILVSAFYTTKQYGRAEDILKKRLDGSPSDVQTWVQLAGVFYAAGDKAGAIATLKSAAAANPGSASQLNQLITQVQTGKAQ